MVKLQNLALLSVAAFVGSSVQAAELKKQNVRMNMGSDRVLTFEPHELTDEVRNLLEEHEADRFGMLDHHGEAMSVKIQPEAVKALEESGLSFKDTTEEWISHFEGNFNDPNLFCHDSDEACAARSMDDFYSSYQSYSAIINRIEATVASSSLATISTLGLSHEGREIKIVEIGDQSKPLAFVMCTIHAREWLPAMYCPYMIEQLAAGHPILDRFSFAVVPIGNPDGYIYSRNVNNMWRKTRKPNSGSSCIGTDPNRNYDNNWGGSGTSSNPCSDIFRGRAPFDNSETAVLDSYASRPNVRNRLISWIDYHSFASVWLSPLGFTSGFPPAVDYNRMSQCMSAAVDAVRAETGQRFRFGPAANLLGPAAGASDDFFYFEHDVIYSFTVEMRGNSFQPSSANIDPNNREIFAGTIAQMECIAEIELDGGSVSNPPTPSPTPCNFFFC